MERLKYDRRTVFIHKRVHLGAYEAGILSDAHILYHIYDTLYEILGFNTAFVDIAIFFISVLFGFIHLWKLQSRDDCGCYGFLIITVAQLIAFWVFTNEPPALGLFIPPVG